MTLVAEEGVLQDDLDRHAEVGLVPLLAPDGLQLLLLLQPDTDGLGNVLLCDGGENLLEAAPLDVDEHGGVGGAADGCQLLPLPAAKVLVNGLAFGAPAHHVIVKLAPLPVSGGVDEHNVMSDVVITAKKKNGYKTILKKESQTVSVVCEEKQKILNGHAQVDQRKWLVWPDGAPRTGFAENSRGKRRTPP
jgi:hypothetical protein